MENSRGFEKAISTVGSQARLAAALGVTEGVVSQWHRRGIPFERCLEIEALTRRLAAERGDPSLIVTCEELRPDTPWSIVRDNPLPAERIPAAPMSSH